MSVSGVGGPRVPPTTTTRAETAPRATAAAPAETAQRATGHSQVSEFEGAEQPQRTAEKPLTDEELQQVDAWAKGLVDNAGYSPEAADRMKTEVLKRMGEFVKNNPNATPEQLAEQMGKAASGARAEEMFNQNWLNQMMSQIQQRAKEALSGLFR